MGKLAVRVQVASDHNDDGWQFFHQLPTTKWSLIEPLSGLPKSSYVLALQSKRRYAESKQVVLETESSWWPSFNSSSSSCAAPAPLYIGLKFAHAL